MRAALYMPTLAAVRWHPVLRDFYERLLRAGKARKVALMACMRKLLVILNAMLKHGAKWEAGHVLNTVAAGEGQGGFLPPSSQGQALRGDNGRGLG